MHTAGQAKGYGPTHDDFVGRDRQRDVVVVVVAHTHELVAPLAGRQRDQAQAVRSGGNRDVERIAALLAGVVDHLQRQSVHAPRFLARCVTTPHRPFVRVCTQRPHTVSL